jgi:hypothetical protein
MLPRFREAGRETGWSRRFLSKEAGLMRIVVEAQLDEQGDLEEFSWDLFPLISARQTLHLRRDGLPHVGTVLVPGMIIVGKIGKSKNCEPHRRPTALETEGLDEAAIRER